MNPMPKGPQGPRRSPEQASAARKEREALEQARQEEMARKMREAYEKAQKRSVTGMKSGGMPDLTGDGKVTRADVLKGRGVFRKGGGVKKYAKGGSVSSASKRADGCAVKGKTRGKIV
jgi:hypothetical protein